MTEIEAQSLKGRRFEHPLRAGQLVKTLEEGRKINCLYEGIGNLKFGRVARFIFVGGWGRLESRAYEMTDREKEIVLGEELTSKRIVYEPTHQSYEQILALTR
ncbi:hypothetical protein HYV50_05915 [Candidatus Pacearchaeota archaeon]|nr:hypothetical protein [Candidatus Pacearchaeota archaeon]